MWNRATYCLVILSISLGTISAQTFLLPEDERLPTFTFSHSKNPKQIRQSVYKVRIVSKDFIEKTNSINLADVLKTQSGMNVVEDNLTGTYTLSMNGQEGKNVQILVNGIPLIGRMLGQIDLSQINLQDIEMIEIVEGPLSSIYGANATAGAINIISKKSQSSKLSGQIKSQQLSIGSNNSSIYLSIPIKKWTSNLSLGRNFFPGKSFEKGTLRQTDWMLKNQYVATFGVQGKIKKTSVSYRLSLLDETLKNKREPYKEIQVKEKDGQFYEVGQFKANDIHYLSRRMDHQLSFVSRSERFERIEFQNAYNYFSREKKSLIHHFNNNQVLLDRSTGVQDTTSFQSALHRAIFAYGKPHLKFFSGYEFQSEWGEGKRIMSSSQNIWSASTFSNADFEIAKKVQVNLGFRTDYNSRFGWSILPNLQFRRLAKKNKKFTTSIAYGQRNPDLKEMYLNFVDANHNVTGNPKLISEMGYNFLFGFEKSQDYSRSKIVHDFNINANWMSNKIQLIVTDPTTAQYSNLGNQHIRNFSYGVIFEKGGLNVNTRNLLTQTIVNKEKSKFSYQATINASQKLPKSKLQINLNANYFSNQNYFSFNSDGADVGIKYLNPYCLMDVFLSRKMGIQHRVSLGFINVMNITQLNVSAASQGQHGRGAGLLTAGLGRTFQLNYQWTF